MMEQQSFDQRHAQLNLPKVPLECLRSADSSTCSTAQRSNRPPEMNWSKLTKTWYSQKTDDVKILKTNFAMHHALAKPARHCTAAPQGAWNPPYVWGRSKGPSFTAGTEEGEAHSILEQGRDTSNKSAHRDKTQNR